MRKRNPKTTCVKKKISKCDEVVYCYDKVMEAIADILNNDPHIVEIRSNIPIEEEQYKEFASDFVCLKDDGSYMVRECCYRNLVLRPRMVKLLGASHRYWIGQGITDWQVVVERSEDAQG